MLTTFQAIVASKNVAGQLKNQERYLAHTPNETLHEHTGLVAEYFLALVSQHGLEGLIDKIVQNIANDDSDVANFLKRLFWDTIYYHDFGKVNENFQHHRMENLTHFPQTVENGIHHQHSILSAYIFLVHQLSHISEKQLGHSQLKQVFELIAAFAHNIMRHHNPGLDDLSSRQIFKKIDSDLCEKLKPYLKCYNITYDETIVTLLPKLSSQLTFEGYSFESFLLVRLNFSLLTASDYYATVHFNAKWRTPYNNFGVLSANETKIIVNNLRSLKSHNQYLYKHYETIRKLPLENFREASYENLNGLRSKMAAEAIRNVRIHKQHRLFYLEAPTGGGKTNISMVVATELMEADPALKKIFYVFPFTTLVTQTAKSALETLGLEEHQWIELHSKAGFKQMEVDEKQNDGLYGDDALDNINNQFVNYPFVFLTHVKFFDVLKANQKESIYLLHRLANSIVIIDEIQAYNPMLWDKIAYLLKAYANGLNIRFIVMSATLPKIGLLAKADFVDLLPNAINNYFTNPNFRERVTFDNSLMAKNRPSKDEKQQFLCELAEKILEKANVYKKDSQGNVRIIVEFIYKKSASDFANIATSIFEGYDIFVLSGTILEPRRRYIINRLKNPEYQSRDTILVTTQVVEAGVDIDMDLGFKDRSLLDSEEQLAGRVNRNVKKQGCIVYLFEMDDPSYIYGTDLRFKELKRDFENNYLEILKSKRFDLVYDKVYHWLEQNNDSMGYDNLKSFRQSVGSFNFPKVDESFKLIANPNHTVFVPLNLLKIIEGVDGNHEDIFTPIQLEFLRFGGIDTTRERISGEEVFNFYRSLVRNKEIHFTDKKRQIRIMQSILSLFSFSLFAESGLVKELIAGGNHEELGFLYLRCHEDIYNEKVGLKDGELHNMIFV